jgi:hypothetical protein
MSRRLARLLTLALAAAALPAPLTAQTTAPPFVVERPSFSTPPDIVGRGFWQVEAGVALTRDTVGKTTVSALTLPNTIFRLGVNRRLELRAGTTGLLRTSAGDRRQTSATDLELGVKYQLAAQSGLGLDISVVPMVSLPTGGAASTRNADPSAILTVARAFGRNSLNGNLKWSAPSVGDAADTRARVIDSSLVLSVGLWGAWSGFVEGVTTNVDTPGTPTTWQGNVGIDRQFGDALEVDIFGGAGLNDAAPNWTIGAGFGWRFRR